MLKYIKVKNFLSFKDETEINFESSFRWKDKKDNVFSIKDNVFAKSTIIYWANASWKTNILRVMAFIKYIASSVDEKKFTFSNFLLDLHSWEDSSFFEICFFVDKKEYLFNFELKDNKILKENLIEIKEIWNIYLYKREKQKIFLDKTFEKEAKKWLEKVKDDVSFFAVLSQWNWYLNKKPINYFFKKINILLDNDIWPSVTVWLLDLTKSEKNKKAVLEFLRCADINIEDIEITKKPIPDEIIQDLWEKFISKLTNKSFLSVRFWHKIIWSDELKYFDLENESSWTQKLFYILWPVIDTILNEKILFVDEIETNIHNHILKNLFNLIHSRINKNYQFIFTSHNIELIDLNIFKKEQIWIVEKNKNFSSEYYTLYDFDNIRKENDVKKMYNIWSFWWVPITNDFSILINEFNLWEKN